MTRSCGKENADWVIDERRGILTNARIMNAGSPYNVPAGSQVQMDKVIEKYKKLANDENERKLEKLRNNDISSEKPFEGKLRVKKAPDMF